MVEINKQNRKRAPITKKIKRLLLPEKGRYMHRLSPKEYFWQCWFNEADSKGIEMVAVAKKVSKRKAAHIMAEIAFPASITLPPPIPR